MGEPGCVDSTTGPHPLLALGGGQRIDVDDDVPLRRVLAVLLERGAPPQSARMGCVLPEVVEMIALASDAGDPGVGVEYVQRVGAHLLESVTRHRRHGGSVVPLDPGQ
jgi:hypothetical protein